MVHACLILKFLNLNQMYFFAFVICICFLVMSVLAIKVKESCLSFQNIFFLYFYQDLVILQAKYANLENQYRSVAAMAKNDKESITAQMDDVKKDVNILTEEKDNLTEEIKKWEEDYKERTGEEPTEEDR